MRLAPDPRERHSGDVKCAPPLAVSRPRRSWRARHPAREPWRGDGSHDARCRTSGTTADGSAFGPLVNRPGNANHDACRPTTETEVERSTLGPPVAARVTWAAPPRAGQGQRRTAGPSAGWPAPGPLNYVMNITIWSRHEVAYSYQNDVIQITNSRGPQQNWPERNTECITLLVITALHHCSTSPNSTTLPPVVPTSRNVSRASAVYWSSIFAVAIPPRHQLTTADVGFAGMT